MAMTSSLGMKEQIISSVEKAMIQLVVAHKAIAF
jgi:hypothetical protein